MNTMQLLAGSYNIPPFGTGNGLDLLRLDLDTGALHPAARIGTLQNPSFLAKSGSHIYAVQELIDRGSVVSFVLDGEEGKEFCVTDSPGGLTCHITVWPGGKCLSAANYWTGSMVTIRLLPDGTLSQSYQICQYHGKGLDPKRQEGPHTHSTCVDPTGKWLLVAELGIDKIFVYSMDGEKLVPAKEPYAQAPGGCGPRHMAFSADGRSLYATAELGSAVLHFGFDPFTGALTLLQMLSALPKEYQGTNLTADIHLSGDGKFLYVSNRGHDSIAAFPVGEDGSLGQAAWYSCYGSEPRHFRLVGDDLMLIANQKTGNLVCCRRDPVTGAVGERCSQVMTPSVVYTLPL